MRQKYFKLAIILWWIKVFFPIQLCAQLKTDPSLTDIQLVKKLIGVHNAVVIGTIAHNWVDNQNDYRPVGSFTVTGINKLGLDSGIILCTGSVVDTDPDGVNGPNNNPIAFEEGGGISHDPDLSIAAGAAAINIQDATVLEFDFIPCSDSIKFNYVFGSEEYPNYVCGDYNDVFIFILNGVNTFLPKTNIALVPGTTMPVSINTINGGSSGTNYDSLTRVSACDTSNFNYFVNNGSGEPGDMNGPTIQYNGYTTVLTAGHAVIPGKTYHIKLAITDVSDPLLDSGVFLEAGSFLSTPYPIDVTANKDTACSGELVEITSTSPQGGLNYTWDFDGGKVISGSGQGPFYVSWATSGQKKIKGRVTENGECSVFVFSDSAYVYVTDAGCQVRVPNVYSPNGDGHNDLFFITGLAAFPESKTTIYNRWGIKVFETATADNYWDGKIANGNDAPDGVYYYVININEDKPKTGYLQLIR